MPPKYCCVPNCFNKAADSFSLTTMKEPQEVWIKRIGNPDLANLRAPSSIRVCRRHFHPECISTDGRLKKFALPTLNLPGYVNSPECDDLFLYSPKKSNPSDSPGKMQHSIETVLFDDGSEMKVQIPRRVYKGVNYKFTVSTYVECTGKDQKDTELLPEPSVDDFVEEKKAKREEPYHRNTRKILNPSTRRKNRSLTQSRRKSRSKPDVIQAAVPTLPTERMIEVSCHIEQGDHQSKSNITQKRTEEYSQFMQNSIYPVPIMKQEENYDQIDEYKDLCDTTSEYDSVNVKDEANSPYASMPCVSADEILGENSIVNGDDNSEDYQDIQISSNGTTRENSFEGPNILCNDEIKNELITQTNSLEMAKSYFITPKDAYLAAIEEGLKQVAHKDKIKCLIEVMGVIDKYQEKNRNC